jgi:hypothetical protein
MTNSLYSTYNDDPKSKAAALRNYGKGKACHRTSAVTTYRDVFSGMSIKDQFNRRDYSEFRPGEQAPSNPHDSMRVCDQAYYDIGLVYNIINLMSDFGSKGAAPIHESKAVNDLYQEWWKLVNGPMVAERFLNYLYRKGNVVVKRLTAKLSNKELDKLQKGMGYDMDYQAFPNYKVERGVIPYKYVFLDPCTIDVIGDKDEAIYTGDIKYGIQVPSHLYKKLGLKQEGKKKYIEGGQLVPLDMDKIQIFHYKKDDWQIWAYPMIHPILNNLNMIEKLRLADLAALDGAISHIRVWKLGSLENKIFPKQAAMDRLAEVLMSNVGGGTLDLIWGPDLELIETATEVYKFLGFDKYIPHMNAIYEGLGIPPSLTGSQSASGMTNNFVSLRTLIERLAYGRAQLSIFLAREFRLFQLAIGARKPAYLIFDRLNISDDSSEKALLVQLLDRNVISEEAVQKAFGEIPALEKFRIKKQEKMRKSGKLPRKAGPWHNPEHKEALEKIALQKMLIDDESVGVDPEAALDKVNDKKKGQPEQGRPLNSKDKEKRKKRTVKPLTGEFTQLTVWARSAQAKIADIINPIFLKMVGKPNLRSLTTEEDKSLEDLKFALLLSSPAYEDLSSETILASLKQELLIPTDALELYQRMCNKYQEKHGELNIDNMRYMQCMVYSILKGGYNG